MPVIDSGRRGGPPPAANNVAAEPSTAAGMPAFITQLTAYRRRVSKCACGFNVQDQISGQANVYPKQVELLGLGKIGYVHLAL